MRAFKTTREHLMPTQSSEEIRPALKKCPVHEARAVADTQSASDASSSTPEDEAGRIEKHTKRLVRDCIKKPTPEKIQHFIDFGLMDHYKNGLIISCLRHETKSKREQLRAQGWMNEYAAIKAQRAAQPDRARGRRQRCGRGQGRARARRSASGPGFFERDALMVRSLAPARRAPVGEAFSNIQLSPALAVLSGPGAAAPAPDEDPGRQSRKRRHGEDAADAMGCKRQRTAEDLSKKRRFIDRVASKPMTPIDVLLEEEVKKEEGAEFFPRTWAAV